MAHNILSMLDIQVLRSYCTDKQIVLTEHLLTRMRQRSIKYEDVKRTILTGEIIEQYETDYPFPSCLISDGTFHLVCSLGNEHLYIITAYRPDPSKWEQDGKTRKELKV
jgi:hypothetical protein